MKELEKTYNPAEIEDRLYDKWLKKIFPCRSRTEVRNHLRLLCRRQILPDSCIWDMLWITPCRIS